MAYLTPESPRRRVAAISAVLAVHGVMAVALLSGFAGGIIKAFDQEKFQAWTYYDPPKPMPTITPPTAPTNSKHETRSQIDAKVPLDPFPTDDRIFDPGPMPTGGLGDDTGPIIVPLAPRPAPSASFTPHSARPLTAPGRWVSDADYPASALRKGEQGVTRFEVTVGPDGSVRNCTVTRSSGSAALDAATCAKVSQRARFDPASDEHGAVVAGRYSNAISWRIPE